MLASLIMAQLPMSSLPFSDFFLRHPYLSWWPETLKLSHQWPQFNHCVPHSQVPVCPLPLLKLSTWAGKQIHQEMPNDSVNTDSRFTVSCPVDYCHSDPIVVYIQHKKVSRIKNEQGKSTETPDGLRWGHSTVSELREVEAWVISLHCTGHKPCKPSKAKKNVGSYGSQKAKT